MRVKVTVTVMVTVRVTRSWCHGQDHGVMERVPVTVRINKYNDKANIPTNTKISNQSMSKGVGKQFNSLNNKSRFRGPCGGELGRGPEPCKIQGLSVGHTHKVHHLFCFDEHARGADSKQAPFRSLRGSFLRRS